MLNIHIISLGSLQSPWHEAAELYITRLKPYAKCKITELKEEKFRSTNERDIIQEKEKTHIMRHIDSTDIVIALEEKGTLYDSISFAKWINKLSIQGDKIVFIIGGPLGLHSKILERANHTISLSSLTFHHQLAKVVLLEQIYRSVTITKGKQYHY